MKKLAIVFVLIALTLTSAYAINLSHAATTTTTTLTVDPATQQFPNAKVGDIIQINITISNVQDLWIWDIEGIWFNPSMLNLTTVTEGPFLQQAGNTMFFPAYSGAQAINEGYIAELSDALIEEAGASGSGVLVTLAFQVLTLGTSQIGFNDTNLENQAQINNPSNPQTMPCNTVNATITVGPTAITTATPTAPSSSSTPTPSSSSNTATPTSSTSNQPTATPKTGSSSTDPTATANSSSVPEFPIATILITLIAAATISLLIATKKKNSKISFS